MNETNKTVAFRPTNNFKTNSDAPNAVMRMLLISIKHIIMGIHMQLERPAGLGALFIQNLEFDRT